MKTHARNLTIGGVLVPVALALATLIANEAQTLIGLHLDNVALSLYLLPFLAGAAAAIAALLRLEATKVGGELGDVLGDLASSILGPPSERPGTPGVPGPAQLLTPIAHPPAATTSPPPPPLPPTPPAP